MRIYYDSENDKIINKVNNEKIIWELYEIYLRRRCLNEKKIYYETIYSLKLTDKDSLILNDKITIYKDKDINNLYPPYRLDIINDNLYIRNSINKYLWSTSEKYPSGNSMIRNTIENCEKLYENEIFNNN
ncbi:hypothetical protein BCR32DRAFT_285717 [Anaeromyces robustus]|uniref:Uncharacterized protein n=1 Tax=Anaeromyces robustus TaxID=1754192 RepID=A0A1Y1VJZ1_9FUNG|nr:hypothetical protein BCR32DRAFT_288068 [Anaeromyces robustus]ORX72558.1 hypothetical protein BCR32DRAFT_285717 [Anaeromyces robustus]|eukprot:ORX57080.1 hypothetical protein BCR32DRAFT_288068 [Anaeromyces robustus]